MKKNVQYYLLALLSGSLVGISLHTGWFALTILGCTGCCLLVYQTQQTRRSHFLAGLLFGTSKILIVLTWGFAVYPISWLGEFSWLTAVILIGLYWGIAALAIGLASGLALYCLSFIPKTSASFIFIALTLTVSESVGAIFYSFIYSGAGSYIQPYFSFGFVGYGLAMSDYFLPLATVGGVYLLSFYSFLLGAVVVNLAQKKELGYGLILILILLTPSTITQEPYSNQGTTASIINTSYSAESLRSLTGQKTKASTTLAAVRTSLGSGAEHIVLPEDARFVDNFPNPHIAQQWVRFQTATTARIVLYDSARTTHQLETILRGYVFDSTATSAYYFDKQYLVPQGEFIPYFGDLGLKLLADPAWRAELHAHLSYRPSGKTHYPNDDSIASFLFCFEAANPLGVALSQQRHHGDFIIHPVSHAWFTTSETGLRNQLVAMLRVQSAWNDTPIIVAGNQFEGFALYPDGRLDTGEQIAADTLWNINDVRL